jgi:hypothetical protein
MASEVFLGPDGGPYVSVNENSGDLELKDNTGTVIANWDSGNSEWNFQNNPLSNIPDVELGPDGGPFVSINENNGDIELKDNSGNVVAFWDESNTQWDLNSNDIQNVGSLGVEETDITNESLIITEPGDTRTLTSDTYKSPALNDPPAKDERGEFSGDQFTPDNDGFYRVHCAAVLFDGADNDRIRGRIQNVTDSVTVDTTPGFFNSGGFSGPIMYSRIVYLTAGKSYEFQVKNENSSDIISDAYGFYIVRSEFR